MSKVQIPQTRKQFGFCRARLRKARCRYDRMVRGEVKRNPDMVFIFAQRAIARGLYAPSTTLKYGSFWLLRAAYKHDRLDGVVLSWDQWLVTHNIHQIWWKMGHNKRLKLGKPVLRLVA